MQMKKNNSYVLLIDDNSDFAREYSETLGTSCGTNVLYATNAEDAIKIVKDNAIKVAIIDQVMPIKGTELFKRIKAIDSNIKTVLLTAEADRHELTEAANMGFDMTLLKEEKDMDELPLKILMLIGKYNAQKYNDGTPIWVKKQKSGLFKKSDEISYFIQKYEVVDENYIDDNGWITRDIIEKGESLTYEEEFNFETDFGYSESFKMETNSSLGLANTQIVEFKNQLSAKMAQDFSNTYTESLKKVLRRKKILDLPKDQDNIVSRKYEYTKVYQQIKVYIRKDCSCCNESVLNAITVYLPIPIIQYRIIEYFSDGTQKEIGSGEIRA